MTKALASHIKSLAATQPPNYMSNEDIPILVVDDAKFSSVNIATALRSSGFSNVRFTDSPLQALRSLEKRPADIVIAGWSMPSMSGLELARRAKALDEARPRSTYVMLLTTTIDAETMRQALRAGADDFLIKADLQSRLLPRVLVAARLVTNHNELLCSNSLLKTRVHELQVTDLVDPVTGLGNLQFAMDRLADASRQAQSRGGAACLLLVGINNLNEIVSQHEQPVADELMSGLGARIRQLVRPLDLVTRPASDMFAIITLQPDIDNCTSESFRRIFDNLYMQSFKTSSGYIPVVVGVSICAADARTGFPEPQQMMEHAHAGLRRSFDTGLISVQQIEQRQPAGTPVS